MTKTAKPITMRTYLANGEVKTTKHTTVPAAIKAANRRRVSGRRPSSQIYDACGFILRVWGEF